MPGVAADCGNFRHNDNRYPREGEVDVRNTATASDFVRHSNRVYFSVCCGTQQTLGRSVLEDSVPEISVAI
jgi:hypothetical protein